MATVVASVEVVVEGPLMKSASLLVETHLWRIEASAAEQGQYSGPIVVSKSAQDFDIGSTVLLPAVVCCLHQH